MPWFVIDDSAHMHPKMVAATNAGVGLWVRAGAYASQHLTDGIVPGVIAKLYGSRPQIAKLVAAGLWHEAGHSCTHPKCLQPAAGDYAIHDYLVYNPSRREVLARRERAAEKKRKQRGSAPNRSGINGDSRPDREGFDGDSSTNRAPERGDAAGHDDASPGDGDGTRAGAPPAPPRPSQGGAESEPPVGGRGRGPLSVIAADWQPSDDDVRAAQLARSDVGAPQLTPQQIANVTRKFVRRMADDGVRAAGFGGRWQQWAENERVDAPPTDGGDVIPFGRRTAQPAEELFGAAMQRAQARMNQEGGR